MLARSLALFSLCALASVLLPPCSHAIAPPPFGPIVGPIFPSSNPQLGLRHCSYVCSATPYERGNDDFAFALVPALSGAPAPAVSLQSLNYPDHYLAIADPDTRSVGIVAGPDVHNATWLLVAPLGPVLSNLSFSLQSASAGALGGLYLSVAPYNHAPCGYAPPAGDAVLSDGGNRSAATWTLGTGPAAAARVEVDPTAVVNPRVSRRTMGCHSDYGFAQTPRGFTANLLYGSSFEDGTMAVPAWRPFTAGPGGSVGRSTGCAFSSRPSMAVSVADGSPGDAAAGLANRGLGGMGLALEGGRDYTFGAYVYPDSSATVFVELHDFAGGQVLARQTVAVTPTGPPWGSNWLRINVSLTPSAGTGCVGIPFGSDPLIDCGNDAGPAHVCVRCGGELRVGVVGPGAVNLGYVSLQPGTWGLLPAADGAGYLPVLASAAAVLKQMGVTVIRSGGTVSQSMRWMDWRGSVWNRPSQQQVWGDSLLSGWGPFEVVDMCNALGIEPVITLAYDTNDAQAWADLVEYCWGDPAATAWGRRRAADGHPQPYRVAVFELGNEQYNPHFVEQVLAMESRAQAVGAPPLRYMFPDNGGLNAQDAQRLLDLHFPVDRIMPDIHVGAGGAVQAAADLFAHPPVPGFNQSAINCETNAGTHDLQRALDEAEDLITWFTADPAVTDRLYARTASFCSGTSAGFDTWDQGISFFLPNMTWLQPPGHVHALFSSTWADQTVKATFLTPATIPLAAQIMSADEGGEEDGKRVGGTRRASASGRALVVRAVNQVGSAQSVFISLAAGSGAAFAGSTFSLYIISGPSPHVDNTPSQPDLVAPVETTAGLISATAFNFTMPAYAVAVAVAALQ